jgi:hypothetical protein
LVSPNSLGEGSDNPFSFEGNNFPSNFTIPDLITKDPIQVIANKHPIPHLLSGQANFGAPSGEIF